VRDLVLAAITALKADTPVATVVGVRVYRKNLPPGATFPAITVSRVSNLRDDDTNTVRYAHSRIQCTAWSKTSDGEADNLSELIANCLHRTTSTVLSTGTTSCVSVISIEDAGIVPDENTDIPLFMYHRDFIIHYDYQ
jgi:hypothetical protein